MKAYQKCVDSDQLVALYNTKIGGNSCHSLMSQVKWICAV